MNTFIRYFLLTLSSARVVAIASSPYHLTAACCGVANEETSLMDCLKKVDYGTRDVAIISYASEDILHYAAYAYGVNSAYAEHNGYEFHFLNEGTGSNYNPRDPRWNRVKILEEALAVEEGWLNNVNYIVWMEADFVLLDLVFDFRKIISENSESDIIIFSETPESLGLKNTGCFIVKNTEWSRQFLRQWWGTDASRASGSDEALFDALYTSKLPSAAHRVKVLSPTVTSYLSETQEHLTHVLHMVEEPPAFRKIVFQLGWTEVCDAYRERRVATPQLGLSKEAMTDAAAGYYAEEIISQLPVIRSSPFILESFYESSQYCLQNFLQLQALGVDVFENVTEFNNIINDLIKTEGSQESVDWRSILALYNIAVPFAELLFEMQPDLTQKWEILNRISSYLSRMEELFHPSMQHIAHELQVNHLINRGKFMRYLGLCSYAKKSFEKALGVLEGINEMIAKQDIIGVISEGFESLKSCTEAELVEVNAGEEGDVKHINKIARKEKKRGRKKTVLNNAAV